jgi:hypothetical protein
LGWGALMRSDLLKCLEPNKRPGAGGTARGMADQHLRRVVDVVKRICSVPDCPKPHYGHGWCNKHHRAWRLYGDPLATQRIFGDDEARFWSYVEKTEDCWLWRGSKSNLGYGHIQIGGAAGRLVSVHRLAYEWLVGPIPEGLELDHLCRIRNCVNPAHLEPVTRGENIRRSSLQEAAKAATRCVAGHPFDEVNTLIRPNGTRRCRECARRRSRESERHRRAAKKAARDAGVH